MHSAKWNRRETVWDSVHTGERWDEEHDLLLYQRDDFYIEVFQHRELNVVKRIRSYKNTGPLQEYLLSSKIKLSGDRDPHQNMVSVLTLLLR